MEKSLSLQKKCYQKAKIQLQFTEKSTTFAMTGIASIWGVGFWIALFNYIHQIEAQIYCIIALIIVIPITTYLFYCLKDCLGYCWHFGALGGVVMLFPPYPDTIIYGFYVIFLMFAMAFTIPAFVVCYVHYKAKKNVELYDECSLYIGDEQEK